MTEARVESEWSTVRARFADAIFIGVPALVLCATAAGRAVPVVWPVALPYFFCINLWARPAFFGGLVATFDPRGIVGDSAVRAARRDGWLVVRTLANRGCFVIAAAQNGGIAARPFAANVSIKVPEHLGPVPRLPLFPVLPPRLRSLPRDWWNAPDLAWKLSLVASLELVFNVVLIDEGQFDGLLILRDLVATVGLVAFAQFYYYARVDMVLRKVEREQAASGAQAPA